MYRQAMPSCVDQEWNELKEKLLLQFTELTKEDLQFETGRKHEMIDKIGSKLGKSQEEMENILQVL